MKGPFAFRDCCGISTRRRSRDGVYDLPRSTAECETVRAVHAGEKALSSEASCEIAEHAIDDALTPAEISALRLIVAGNANKQIADH